MAQNFAAIKIRRVIHGRHKPSITASEIFNYATGAAKNVCAFACQVGE
jgi:hypothetical protein